MALRATKPFRSVKRQRKKTRYSRGRARWCIMASNTGKERRENKAVTGLWFLFCVNTHNGGELRLVGISKRIGFAHALGCQRCAPSGLLAVPDYGAIVASLGCGRELPTVPPAAMRPNPHQIKRNRSDADQQQKRCEVLQNHQTKRGAAQHDSD